MQALASPYQQGLIPEGGIGLMETYRGCPFSCSFCEWGVMEAPRNVRSPENILQEFAARRINLSNLLSRPTKRGGLGDYCFIVYADGHVADELLADVLRSLHSKQGAVKFLGSYPAAGEHAHSAREHADTRWREADDWVESLRVQISPS